MSPSFWKRVSGFTAFHGGVSPRHAKHTKDAAIVDMPIPATLVVPMSQHIGAPCIPTVKPGDTVRKGQVIGDTEAVVSAPIHAPTSGKVKSVGEVVGPTHERLMAVTLTTDGEDLWDETLSAPEINSKEDFLQAVRASGLVGLGGAGFPTHVKLRAPEGHRFEHLIINGAECEPYLTVDNRAMIEETEKILYGLQQTMRWLEIPSVIFGIEDNKPEAIAHIRESIQKHPSLDASKVQVKVLPTRYPQGAEKTLVYATTGRVVPLGGLPSAVGCVVLNVTTLMTLGDYLMTGHPLVSKNLTIDGDAVVKPQNIRALIGTSIEEVLNFCGGLKEEPRMILMGGPMMGLAITDRTQPIIKNNNGILALSDKAANRRPETDCIRCGRCAAACPMYLMPKAIMDMIKFEKYSALPGSGVNACIGCGSCAYECPAHIPLVHYMKLGNAYLRKEAKSK